MASPSPLELSTQMSQAEQRLTLLDQLSHEHAGLLHALDLEPELLLGSDSSSQSWWQRLQAPRAESRAVLLERRLEQLHQRVVRLDHHVEHLHLELAGMRAEQVPSALVGLHHTLIELADRLLHGLRRLQADSQAALKALGAQLPALAAQAQARDLHGAAQQDLDALRGLVARVLREGEDSARLTREAVDRVADEVELLRGTLPEQEAAQRELMRALRKARVGLPHV